MDHSHAPPPHPLTFRSCPLVGLLLAGIAGRRGEARRSEAAGAETRIRGTAPLILGVGAQPPGSLFGAPPEYIGPVKSTQGRGRARTRPPTRDKSSHIEVIRFSLKSPEPKNLTLRRFKNFRT